MAFRYPLQSVLRLRCSLERQAELVLFSLAGKTARLRAEIEELDREELETKLYGLEEMAGGSFAAMLQYVEVCENALTERRRGLVCQLAAAEKQRLEQLPIYRRAREKREILDSVRERQESIYELDISRREQQRADETFLLRKFFDQQD